MIRPVGRTTEDPAGNNSANVDASPTYPCSFNATNMICVAATDSSDTLASFSNYGRTSVHLGAPGKNILSTIPGSNYAYYSGTSMATPHVSGAAVLILSAPGQAGLTVDQLKSAILTNVDSVASLAGITATGGRLNVCKAIPGCSNTITPTPTTTKPTSTFTPSPTFTFTPSPTFTLMPTPTPQPPFPLAPSPTTTATSTPTSTATPAPNADYAITANPFSQTVAAGASANYTVAVRAINGFNSSVTLSVNGLPLGATATFSANPLMPMTLGTISALKITTSPATPAGTYSLTITGKATNAASAAHSITVMLNVSDAGKFSIALNERWLILRRNSTSTFTVRVASSGGFNSPVNLSVNGLPPWITATFNPNPVTPNPGGAATNLTITTGNSYGAFALSIAGTGGSQTRSVPLLLIIW